MLYKWLGGLSYSLKLFWSKFPFPLLNIIFPFLMYSWLFIKINIYSIMYMRPREVVVGEDEDYDPVVYKNLNFMVRDTMNSSMTVGFSL